MFDMIHLMNTILCITCMRVWDPSTLDKLGLPLSVRRMKAFAQKTGMASSVPWVSAVRGDIKTECETAAAAATCFLNFSRLFA